MAETWWIQPTREAFSKAVHEQEDRFRRESNKVTNALLGSWTDVKLAKAERDKQASENELS